MKLSTPSASAPKLLDLVRDRIRVKHYSIRAEASYVQWIKRFILFHGKRHPREVGAAEVEAFLTHLAVKYPNAPLEWPWKYVFVSGSFSTDPRSGAVRRHHLDEKLLQRAMKKAVMAAGIANPATPHTLYVASFVRHAIIGARAGYSDDSGAIGAQGCGNDDDLYACDE